MTTPPLRSPVARSTPSGLKATALTQSVCFFIVRFERSVGGRIDADDFARAAQCNQRLVGTDVGPQHGIELVAHLENPLAGLHVPDDDAAARRALSAAGQKQQAVPAEFQDSGLPSGNGRTPTSSSVFVLYSRTCFCPATAASGDQGLAATRARGRRTRRANDRLQGSAARAWAADLPAGRWAALSARSSFGFLPTAALLPGFERTAVDPLGDGRQHVGGKFVRLGRHVRFGRVRHQREQVAVVGTARFDHGPRSAARHRARVVVRSRPAVFFSVLWQAKHFSRKIGSHVVFVSDLRPLRRRASASAAVTAAGDIERATSRPKSTSTATTSNRPHSRLHTSGMRTPKPAIRQTIQQSTVNG